MNPLCAIFGHKPPIYNPRKGWWSPGEQYGSVVALCTDGIGRVHAMVRGDCARCGTEFDICRVHVPPAGRLDTGPT